MVLQTAANIAPQRTTYFGKNAGIANECVQDLSKLGVKIQGKVPASLMLKSQV
jgi:hypothetical protein